MLLALILVVLVNLEIEGKSTYNPSKPNNSYRDRRRRHKRKHKRKHHRRHSRYSRKYSYSNSSESDQDRRRRKRKRRDSHSSSEDSRRRRRNAESKSKSDRDRHSDTYKDDRRKEVNEERQQKDLKRQNNLEEKKEPKIVTAVPARAGGVYIPPWKMEKMMNDLKNQDPNSKEHQKFMWEQLRKSINGLINKVNVSNIQNIILELFNENIIRGRGLLTKAIFKAQMASPNFSHVYAALVAVVNTKLPEVIKLLIGRYILQFLKAYKRNNKIVCMASIKMIAHMVNQQVLHEVVALEILSLFLENPTEDSIEMAADLMIE